MDDIHLDVDIIIIPVLEKIDIGPFVLVYSPLEYSLSGNIPQS